MAWAHCYVNRDYPKVTTWVHFTDLRMLQSQGDGIRKVDPSFSRGPFTRLRFMPAVSASDISSFRLKVLSVMHVTIDSMRLSDFIHGHLFRYARRDDGGERFSLISESLSGAVPPAMWSQDKMV